MTLIDDGRRANYEQLAMADYDYARGRFYRVRALTGYRGNDSHDIDCDAVVYIDNTAEEAVLHSVDEWIDPYWDVTVVDGMPDPPLRSCWINGKSWNVKTGAVEEGDCVEEIGTLDSLLYRVRMKLGWIPDPAPEP